MQDIAAAVRSVCQALLPLLVAVGETSWSANKHASQLEKAVQALHNDRSRLESSAIQARLDDIETMTKNTHAMLKALVDQRGLPSAGQ